MGSEMCIRDRYREVGREAVNYQLISLRNSPLYRVGLAAEGRQNPKIKCFSCGLRNFPLVPGDLATRGEFLKEIS